MTFIELLLIGAALSMDAFAVAVCKGLAMKKFTVKNAVIVGAYFGFFQALMPLIGYYLGSVFSHKIQSVDHWIAFVLLSAIGSNMIYESFKKDSGCECESNTNAASLAVGVMLTLAVATSIDALAMGVTFAFLSVNIFRAITVIGICTFLFSFAGVKIGTVFGDKYEKKAERAGGIILVALGAKILIEHLFF